ncbi:MAG: NHL repeat-containing protein [Ignavibacteriales bacterium]|nr:NHL repeat-containing protein [Ignavibacteriales bacterium]
MKPYKTNTTSFFLCLFLLIVNGAGGAQTMTPVDSFGKFTDAAAFCMSELGELYVAQASDSRIFKIDTTGKILQECGGFGWEPGLFDHPVSIAPGLLRLYVADKNNHRVQVFDRNLALIAVWESTGKNSSLFEMRYPQSVCTNKKGEVFVLNSDSKLVLKFDPDGNYISSFGGNSQGEFRLENPGQLLALENNAIGATDGSRIVVFDSYGNGTKIIPLQSRILSAAPGNGFKGILTTEGLTILMDDGSYKEYRLPDELTGKIIGMIFKQDKLYCLTAETIFICSL